MHYSLIFLVTLGFLLAFSQIERGVDCTNVDPGLFSFLTFLHCAVVIINFVFYFFFKFQIKEVNQKSLKYILSRANAPMVDETANNEAMYDSREQAQLELLKNMLLDELFLEKTQQLKNMEKRGKHNTFLRFGWVWGHDHMLCVRIYFSFTFFCVWTNADAVKN